MQIQQPYFATKKATKKATRPPPNLYTSFNPSFLITIKSLFKVFTFDLYPTEMVFVVLRTSKREAVTILPSCTSAE